MIQTKKLSKLFLVIIYSIIIFIFINNINQNVFMNNTTLLLIFFLIIFFVSCVIFSVNIINPFMFFLVYYFLGCWDVISSALQLRNTKLIWNINIYEKTLFIIVFWFTCFTLGYFINFKFIKYPKKTKYTIPLEKNKKTYYLLVPLIIFTIYIFSNIFSDLQSLTSLINAPLVGEGKLAEGKGFLLAFTYIIGLIPVILVANKKKKLGIVSSIIIFFLMIITGRRSMSFKAAFVPILIFWNFKEKKIGKKWLVIGSMFVIFIVSIIGSIRTVNQSNFSFTNVENNILSQFVVLGKYIGYGDNLVDLVGKIDTGQVSFQKLNFIFRGIEYLIPRSLWLSKPSVHSGEIVSGLIYFTGDVGRPVGSFGWAYLQLGLIGVFFSGLFTGMFTKKLYRWVIERNDLFSLGMYGLIILPMLEMFLPESQMLIMVNSIIWISMFIMCPKNTMRGDIDNGENFRKTIF